MTTTYLILAVASAFAFTAWANSGDINSSAVSTMPANTTSTSQNNGIDGALVTDPKLKRNVRKHLPPSATKGKAVTITTTNSDTSVAPTH